MEITKKLPKIYLFHPTSIIILLVLDWGGFLLEIPQILSPFTMFLTSLSIFSFSGFLIYIFQHHFAGDSKKDCIIKAILGGIICAFPAPLMSTIVGSIILALSGFENIKQFGLDGIGKMFEKKKKD